MAVTKLPEELLLEIFNFLFVPPPSSAPSADTPRHRPDGAALYKVSRNFRRLAIPLLYTHLDINFDECPSSAAHLHSTLSENPHLRSYCRSLRITLPDPDVGTGDDSVPLVAATRANEMASDMIKWLENTEDLTISGYFTHPMIHAETWSLVQSAGVHMANLKRLSLGKQVWIERVCELLTEMRQLRTLEIGIGAAVEDIVPPPPELVGSSSVTSLSIDYLLAVPGNLDRLLLRPAALEHFAFRGMFPGCYWSWSLAELVESLRPHQRTLRTIHVASARAGGVVTDNSLEDEVDDVDLGDFRQLKGITFVAAPA